MRPQWNLYPALLGILLPLIGILAFGWILASQFPPAHAEFAPVTSLSRVEDCVGFKFPAGSTREHGVYRPQWTGMLYCKVRLSPSGLTQLKSELSIGEHEHLGDREGFTELIRPHVVVDPEVHSSREYWIAGGGKGGSAWTMMIVNDDKSAPAAFVYWCS